MKPKRHLWTLLLCWKRSLHLFLFIIYWYYKNLVLINFCQQSEGCRPNLGRSFWPLPLFLSFDFFAYRQPPICGKKTQAPVILEQVIRSCQWLLYFHYSSLFTFTFWLHSQQRYHKIEEATSNHKNLYIQILRSMWTWRKRLGERNEFQ